MAFHRLSRLGVPPVDKLRFVWPSLLIHAEVAAAGPILSPKDSDSFRTTIYCGRRYVLEFATCTFDRGTFRSDGGPRTARRVRAGDIFAAPRTSPRQGEALSKIVSEGRLYERNRTVAGTAGRRHRIHLAPAADRGLMAAENDKLEIVPERNVEVRETRKLFRLAPLRTTTSAGPAARSPSSLRIRRTRPEQIASKHDAFGRDWRDPLFAACDSPGNIGDPRFRRRDLPFRAGRGGRPEARGEAQMTWNARRLNSFSAHDRLTFPTA